MSSLLRELPLHGHLVREPSPSCSRNQHRRIYRAWDFDPSSSDYCVYCHLTRSQVFPRTDETSQFSRARKTKTQHPLNISQGRATNRLPTFDFESSSVDRTLRSSNRPYGPSLHEKLPSPSDPQNSLSTQSPIPSSFDSQDPGPADPMRRSYVHLGN
jgi:hypothetical protein